MPNWEPAFSTGRLQLDWVADVTHRKGHVSTAPTKILLSSQSESRTQWVFLTSPDALLLERRRFLYNPPLSQEGNQSVEKKEPCVSRKTGENILFRWKIKIFI